MKYELHGITYGTTEWAPDYLAGGLSTAPPLSLSRTKIKVHKASLPLPAPLSPHRIQIAGFFVVSTQA